MANINLGQIIFRDDMNVQIQFHFELILRKL